MTKIFYSLILGIILLSSTIISVNAAVNAGAEIISRAAHTNTILEMTLFSRAVSPEGFDEFNSVSGFLRDGAGGGIADREILIYANNILIGKTNTDPEGCFYINSWDNTKVKPMVDDAKSKGIDSITFKVRSIFLGDNDHRRSMAYRYAYTYLAPMPLPPPQFLVETNEGSYDLKLAVNAGESGDLPIVVKTLTESEATNIPLYLVGVPCKVQASILTNVSDNAKATIHISVDSSVKPGNYTLGIITTKKMIPIRALGEIHLTVKSKSSGHITSEANANLKTSSIPYITIKNLSVGLPYEQGNANSIHVGTNYQIVAKITRNTPNFNSKVGGLGYVLILQIKDPNDFWITDVWNRGSLLVGESTEIGIDWRFNTTGKYTVQAFVWASLEGTPLADMREITVNVT